MSSKVKILVSFLALMLAGTGFSEEKYLITMPGPKASIAKSFKELGPGKYEFILDTSKKIKGGKNVTFDVVKTSLLKKKLVKEVSGAGDKVVVTYTGTLKKFLKKMSKTRIKPSGSNVDLAMESSVSDGGVRARTAAREPGAGEVKGTIVGMSGRNLRIMVQKKGPSGIPPGFPMMRPVAVAAGSYKGTPGQVVFFKPTKKTGAIWNGKDFVAK